MGRASYARVRRHDFLPNQFYLVFAPTEGAAHRQTRKFDSISRADAASAGVDPIDDYGTG